MSDHLNIETAMFTNGVTVTRQRAECPVHRGILDCQATSYTLRDADGHPVDRILRCNHLGLAPEERRPVRHASATVGATGASNSITGSIGPNARVVQAHETIRGGITFGPR